ncbi:MAG: Uma2 family endonuclease [Chloroflexia bacterium]|nr:Uma2 family endonuclease [Chloroflexia bacterium]
MSATPQQAKQQAPSEVPPPVTLRLRPVIDLTPDQLLEISSLNDDFRLELTSKGELIVMPPTGGETGDRCSEVNLQLRTWAKKDGTGIVFGSSVGFRLPNSATLSPDASWMARSRWETLSPEERRKFPPLCPDFVIELRSPSDRFSVVQRKMREWLDNGAQLGWLIDPDNRRVHVYRPDTPVEQLNDPDSVSGDPVLPGFVLDLREIW